MIIFIDRDGTLIQEPESEQINSIEEVLFMPYVLSPYKSFLALDLNLS